LATAIHEAEHAVIGRVLMGTLSHGDIIKMRQYKKVLATGFNETVVEAVGSMHIHSTPSIAGR